MIYAQKNNIDLQQGILNERLAKLQLQQSQLSQIPNAFLSGNYGRSFGRSIDPTSNQFINSNYDFVGINGNVDVLLFGWFQKRNQIKADKFSLKSAEADYEQLKNDISLNVATGFLRILLAKEQVAISENQLKFSNNQRSQTQAFVKAGRSPELDLAQMEAQVSADSAAYFQVLVDYQRAILEMKALMNLEINTDFEVQIPDEEQFDFTEVIQHTPEQIFQIAANNFYSIKSSEYKIEAAHKNLASRKSALYPQIGIGAQVGTNYSTTLRNFEALNSISDVSPTGDFINVGGNAYPVMRPVFDFSSSIVPLGNQLEQNFRQTVALSISIPLFNGWAARTSVAQAKIDISNQQLNKERTEIALKQDVYTAYYEANTAVRKYFASQKAVIASERALSYAEKRYELGLMNALELLTTQNNHFRTVGEHASAKYDMIFKLKVIDYYLGKTIKL